MNAKTLKITRPESAGMSYEGLENAFRVLSREIEKSALPGAVAAVGRHGAIVGFRSYGWAQAYGQKRLMQMDTIFDLASLTKVVATLPSVLRLVDMGLIRLDDGVRLFLPEWVVEGSESVRVRHLLSHTSGLPAHRRFWEEGLKGEDIKNALFETPLEAPPGTRMVYSDLGFIMLGLIVERITGMDIAAFAKKHVFEPLGMKDTTYLPADEMRSRVAATEFVKEADRFLVGEVHDENARAMGGVAGHAGLFSTAQDLCVFCQMILNRGIYNGVRVLSAAAIEASAKNFAPPGYDPRGLGWALKGKEFSSAGDLLSDHTIYHTGFTGTALYIDRAADMFIVLLTNRVHPTRENDSIIRIRPRFCNAVAASVEDWGVSSC